jgi:hypothetical protein
MSTYITTYESIRVLPSALHLNQVVFLAIVACMSLLWCVGLVISSGWVGPGGRGVPEWWTALFTAANHSSLGATSKGRAAGWAAAVAIQSPTIVFCLLTGQRGFVIGFTISMILFLAGWRRACRERATDEHPERVLSGLDR